MACACFEMCSYQIVISPSNSMLRSCKSEKTWVPNRWEKGMKRDPHKMMTWGSQCLSNMNIFVHDLGRVNDSCIEVGPERREERSWSAGFASSDSSCDWYAGPPVDMDTSRGCGIAGGTKAGLVENGERTVFFYGAYENSWMRPWRLQIPELEEMEERGHLSRLVMFPSAPFVQKVSKLWC